MMPSRSVLDRALDAAVEVVLEEAPPLPVMPSSSALCAELGIGVSTFYRLFGSVDEYRDSLVDEILSAPYDFVEPELMAELNGLGDADPADTSLEAAALRIAVLYDKAIATVPAPHADWMPWILNETVRASLHRSAHASADREGPAVADVVEHFARRLLGSGSARDLVLRQIAITIASKLCGVGHVRWPHRSDDLPLVVMIRWRLGFGLVSGPLDEPSSR